MDRQDMPRVEWQEQDQWLSAFWRSEAASPPPRQLQAVDDSLRADAALRLLRSGCALVWRGDFHNARQLLTALTRRLESSVRQNPDLSLTQRFHQQRMMQGQRMRLLSMLLIPVQAGHCIPLRRAPDVSAACEAAWGAADGDYLVSLRELQGAVGAWEWRQKGVFIPALDAPITPHYGVFSPVRGEYVDLVARAPLPSCGSTLAMDIGTGTGVLAAVLARRGWQVLATDQDPRALACARDNMRRLQAEDQVQVVQADLFPPDNEHTPARAALLLCNPPWLPGKPASPLEYAIYDPDSRMLRAFLERARRHLLPGGEAWLIMSNLAELLGLREPEQLQQWIASAGLQVKARLDTRPTHPRSRDAQDPLHQARAAEVTSLWQLQSA